MYGSKFRGGVFAGYLKNLGASKSVTGVLGTGTNIDQLNTLGAELTYNRPNWKFEQNILGPARGMAIIPTRHG